MRKNLFTKKILEVEDPFECFVIGKILFIKTAINPLQTGVGKQNFNEMSASRSCSL